MNGRNIHTKIVEEVEEFLGLQGEWENLCEQLRDEVSIFASFTWYEIWWRFYGSGATLNLLTMREDDRLVGIAPFMRKGETLHGLSVKVIGFIENRQSLHNDFIVLPDFRKLFLREVVRHLFKKSAHWDVVILRHLPATSPNYADLVEVLEESRKRWQQIRTWIDSPFLLPSGTWREYLANRTLRTRKNLRNIQNKMNRAGIPAVTNTRKLHEFSAVKEDLFRVAKQSWTENIGDSIASPKNRGFFEDLVCSAAEKGWLSFWDLRLDGRIIAIELHFRAYGKEHAIRSHFLPEFSSLSPGTYLEMKIIEKIFSEKEKVKFYDFCGDFESYKRKWTNSYVSHLTIFLFNKRYYSRFVAFCEGKVNFLKNFARNRGMRWPPENFGELLKLLRPLKRK